RDGRITFVRLTLQAAKLFLPLGSGMGTFMPVYAGFEKPEDTLLDTYVNRAHNDVLEVILEAGAVGLILMVVFVAWFIRTAIKVWRRNIPEQEFDIALARAATIVIGLILAHCLVDYPLRTGALMGILAFSCGLLMPAAHPNGKPGAYSSAEPA